MTSPVLFLIFKRAETTRRVFGRIREARPPRLYIAADGPRADRVGEAAQCVEARAVVAVVDWPCEVHRLYQDKNLGCGQGVSTALSWFFEQEEQGIIIEDDILPHLDFFRYCDEMLERFKDDGSIQLIAGSNYFYNGFDADVSYYLSSYMHIWGWASWRRVWQTYDFDLNHLSDDRMHAQLFKLFPKPSAKYFWKIYQVMKRHEIDTWDYQLFMNQQYYNRYAISPYVNMVENIGIGGHDATHTTEDTATSNPNVGSPFPLKHPEQVSTNRAADLIAMKTTGQYQRPLMERIYRKVMRTVQKLL